MKRALERFVYRTRGRPPLRPFLRAAAPLAAEEFRPPMRPSSASHSGPENNEERRPGTLRSRSRPPQCRPPPRPRTSTARRSLGLAPLRPEISFTGNVIVAPFVSSIRSARSWERYAAKAARGSVLAARRPAREARAKFARSSFSIQPGFRSDLRMQTERLGSQGHQNCPKFAAKRLKEFVQVVVLDGGRYWARTSDLCRVKAALYQLS
jgi:hypothetical protein